MNRQEKNTVLWLSILLNIALIIVLLVMNGVHNKTVAQLEQELAQYASLELAETDDKVASDTDVSASDEAAAVTTTTTSTTESTEQTTASTTAESTSVKKTTTATAPKTTTTTKATTTTTTTSANSGDNDGGWVDGWY